MPIVLDPPQVTFGSGAPGRAIPGSGRAIPTSILGTTYEVRGLRLNNRQDLEHYWVKSLDGLYDSEVRDNREVNPDRDGETYFGGLYAGKPITMEGIIRAHTLEKMLDMQYALTEAFDNLDEEFEFVGRTGDITRDWVAYLAKTGSIALKDEQGDWEFNRAFMIPLRASKPNIFGLQQKSATTKIPHYVNMDADPQFNAGIAGWVAAVGGAAPVPVISYDAANDRLLVDGQGAMPANSAVGVYKDFAVTPGKMYAARAKVGITAGVGATNGVDILFDWRNLGGNVQYNEELVNTPVPNAGPFDVTKSSVMAPDGATTLRVWVRYVRDDPAVAPDPDFWVDDFLLHETYDDLGEAPQAFFAAFYEPPRSIVIDHVGNRKAQMILVVHGSQTDFSVGNTETGQEFGFKAGRVVPVGASWEIDFAEGTIFDQNGVNKFDAYNHGTDWMYIAPNTTQTLTFNSSNRDDNSAVTVYWRDTYK